MFPKSLRIGPHVYKVWNAAGYEVDEQEVFGFCDTVRKIIAVSTETDDRIASASCQDEALLHEIFEAINCDCGLDLDHRVLSTLSNNLLTVMRDNRLNFAESPMACGKKKKRKGK